jgi:hypothetical protein
MSQQNDYERVVVDEPTGARREEIRTVPRSGGNAGWWIAALVAIVAIVGLVYVFNNGQSTPTDLQAARDSGRAEAMMNSATQQAQIAAGTAAQASRDASDRAVSASQAAADNARASADQATAATERAAANANQAAQDAAAQAATDTAPPQ